MAWHLACYKQLNPTYGKSGMRSRYNGRCQHCGFYFEAGSYIVWTRRGISDTDTASLAAAVNPAVKDLNVEPVTNAPQTDLNVVAAAMAAVLVPHIAALLPNPEPAAPAIDVDALTREVTARVLSSVGAPTRIEIFNLESNTSIDIGIQHKQFPTLLAALSARVNVWLAGPSGSGKTTAAAMAAKALGLEFRYTGAVGDAYALTGYNDANGRYIRTPFREAWENGGLFLWDEVDASDPNALLAFNAALANGHAAFPDGVIPRHKDCVLVAAANTYGHGATHEYVGRLKLDAAFLKRFAFLTWDYDHELEMATAANKEWCKRVQQVRAKVSAAGIRVLVTPRETYIGERLLAAGLSQEEVENMTIRSGMTSEQWARCCF